MSVRDEQVRGAVICGLRANRTVPEIVAFNNIPKSTVYDIKKRFEAFVSNGGDKDEFSVSNKVSKALYQQSEENIQAVRDAGDENPGLSMRRLSAEIGVPQTTVRRIVHEDLSLNSYKLRRGQFLTETTK